MNFPKGTGEPHIFTTTQAEPEALELLADRAIVHQGQTPQLSPHKILSTLENDGMRAIHSEGGPSIFARFVAADVVDQHCLTLSPLLVALVRGGLPTLAITRSPTAHAHSPWTASSRPMTCCS